MKKYKIVSKKRFIVSLICMALVLLAAVGGTLAMLQNSGAGVTNKFLPARVTTDVLETLNGKNKTDIKVKNTGNTPAYIRAAVVMNWVDSEGVVVPGTLPALPALSSDWEKGDDGFYYYTKEVAPDKTTVALFSGAITEPTDGPAGAHLQVSILADGIQSQGTGKNYKECWGAVPAADQGGNE